MKPIPLIIGGIAGIAVLWSAGWFAGKTLYVEPEADNAVAQLRAGDLFFSFEDRTVGGFPFSYEVAYEGVEVSDASALWRWAAPVVAIGSGVADGGVLTLRPSPTSRLEIAAPALGGDTADAPSVFDVTSDDLAIRLSEGDAGVDAALSAKALTATQSEAAGVLSGAEVSLTAPKVDAVIAGDFTSGADAGGTIELNALAETMALAYRLSPDGVREDSGRSESRDVEIRIEATGDLSEGMAEFVASGGSATVSFASAGYEAAADATGGATSTGMKMMMTGGASSGEVTIAEGRAAYQASAAEMRYDVEMGEGGPFPGGVLTLAAASARLETPLLRAEDPAPFVLAMSLGDLEADEAFWTLFDPSGAVDRTSINLTLDLGGTARLFSDFGAEVQGAPPPEVETIEIREAVLTGLGVSVSATGALDTAGDASRPDGDVRVEIEGAMGLLDRLVAGGVVVAAAADFYRSLALNYGLVDGGDDRLEALIVARNGAVTLNGLPLTP